VRKASQLHTVGACNNKDHPMRSLYHCLFAPHIYGCYSPHTSHSWWITHSTHRQLRGCNNIPSFLQRTTPIARSLCEGCTWNGFHILVTETFCCDRKVRVASGHSFTLWQQATIEITRRNHSVIACSRRIYIGVILRAHPVRGESHIKRNANPEVAAVLCCDQSWTHIFISHK